MDFRIRNSFIKKFLSNYANQNELKIVKYLAIIGIQSLEKLSKDKFSYSDLKNYAKQLTKSTPKEDKHLNKELKIIKNELAKLNGRFEEKYVPVSPQKVQTVKDTKDTNAYRSTSAPRNYDAKMLTRKAPSTWRAGDNATFQEAERERRANSNEPHPDWAQTRQKTHHATPSVTLKPTEISFPKIDPRENINHVTRHHLDDTQARQVLNEEGVIYFPEKEKETTKKQQTQTKQSQQKQRASHKGRQDARDVDEAKHSPLTRYSMTQEQFEDENQDEVTPRSGNMNKSKSPQLQSRGNLQKDTKFRSEEAYDGRQHAQDTFGPSYRRGEDRERSGRTQKGDSMKFQQKSMQEKGKSRSGKLSRSKLNQTQVEPQREYNHVESKIKDDVNYDKELSRHYKKMKSNMRNYDSHMEEDISASSSHYSNQDKFVLVGPKEGAQRHRQSQGSSRYQSAYYNNSHLLESASSVAKSINMQGSPNHLFERTGDYNMSATRHRRTENARNEDASYYKSIAGENQGGILDIANSFLNSPLMQHLSNIDSKHSEDSSKDSSSSGENSKRLRSHVRVTTFDSKSPSLFPKSPVRRYEGVDESRRLEPHSSQNLKPVSHQHKYSDWVGVYKPDAGAKTQQSMALKDSDNKRYADYGSKDSRMYENKDDTSSMTSSAFSNFLNDEMKVFFRKETYELKKNKNSKSMMRPDDSEISSNNTSFPRNDVNRTIGGGPTHSRKVTNQHYYDNNKSYNGLPLDNVNIFHNERLSVTRVLNNS